MQSETKRIKEESSECQIGSLDEEYPNTIDDAGESSVVVTALDNHLILQEIFKFLSPGDLRVCCEVSVKWRDISAPMIFEYHLKVDRDSGIKVVTTKAYLNPQIEKRNSSPAAETAYLDSLQRRNCFISLEFCGYPWTREAHERDNHSTVNFVKKFASRVYKLSCAEYNYLGMFFCKPRRTQDLQLLPYFPNCEEFSVNKMHSLDWFSDIEMSSPMEHLRKFDHGSIGRLCKPKNFLLKTPTFLRMMTNLQEIHGVPFTMINHFVKVNKLHLIRSVRFHGVNNVKLEVEAMKRMVQTGIKFKFLRIGRNNAAWTARQVFIERNKQHFHDLLELGKDTLEHLELHFERPEEFLFDIPVMSVLTNLTLKVQGSHGPVHFPEDFNFSQCFPKLTTISFPTMSLEAWEKGGSWWGSKGKPGWAEFREGIKNLKCSIHLSGIIQRKLLRRFPGVDHIDLIGKFDHSGVDGIVSD